MNIKKISVVVPIFNEENTVNDLVHRLANSLSQFGWKYELVFVDDHSTDNTIKNLNSLKIEFPIQIFPKKGKKGKAFSLVEGFQYAKGDVLAIIDADLQYPPEDLPEMIKMLENYDLVIGWRKKRWLHQRFRNIGSHIFSFLGKLFLSLDCDTQAGLKVFKKDVLEAINFNTNPWSFDVDFIYKAKRAGFKIGCKMIDFENNPYRPSRFRFSKVAYDLGTTAIKLWTLSIPPTHFTKTKNDMRFAGVWRKNGRFVTHTTLNYKQSAVITMSPLQKTILLFLLAVLLICFALNWFKSLSVLIAFLTILYFLNLLFDFYLIIRSLRRNPETVINNKEVGSLRNEDCPSFSILCPLYKEKEILSQFVKAMIDLDYPKDKLEIHLLLEEDDLGTINKAYEISPPPYFSIEVVPDSQPRTKPKALNWGLAHSKGDYVVIYDAEDIPEADQLKKAAIAFSTLGKDIFCLQAKLNFYNPKQNILTKLFTSEYSLWFDLILPGLNSLSGSIPLGGTSNFFRRKELVELEGWDAFNVCEDCDLGMRLFKKGHQTVMFNSTTYEEANSNLKSWMRQRSHWIKGYIQSFFVHLREPAGFIRSFKEPHILTFLLVVGGKTLSVFINPFLWIMTLSYFLFRPITGNFIESFYPTHIFYIAAFTLVFGNFIYLYNYMIGCVRRGSWYLIKYAYLVPFYWLLMSFAAWKALYQLLVKPYYWEKTQHGLHLNINKT